MQNHLEITSKSLFWTRSVQKYTKTLTLVMSGPAKASPGGQVLVSKAGFPFFFLRNYKVYEQIYHFIKSYVLCSEFMIF